MSRPPSGMLKRGAVYYTRIRRTAAGKPCDRWVALGRDRKLAEREHYRLRGSGAGMARAGTVAEAALVWLKGYVEISRSPRTRATTRVRVEKYLGKFLGDRRLDRLTGEHIRQYRLELEGEKIAPVTVKHVLSDLRCMLIWAIEAGLLDRSPWPKRVMPRIPESPPKRLTDEQVEKLAELPEGPLAWTIRLALGTGMRWAELCRAQRADLDGDLLVIGRTKSGKVRRIPLMPDLLAEVRGRIGKLIPFNADNPGNFNRQVRHRTGLEKFHVHQCRHEFACRFLAVTRDLAALQELLGHASIVTTQRYARLLQESVRSAMAKFAEAGAR